MTDPVERYPPPKGLYYTTREAVAWFNAHRAWAGLDDDPPRVPLTIDAVKKWIRWGKLWAVKPIGLENGPWMIPPDVLEEFVKKPRPRVGKRKRRPGRLYCQQKKGRAQ